MNIRFQLFVLTAILLSTPASADLLTIRQDLVVPNSDERVEVTTFLAESEQDRAEVITRLRKSLAEDLAKNPNLLTRFETLTAPDSKTKNSKSRNPSSETQSGEDEAKKAVNEVAAGKPVTEHLLPEGIQRTLRTRYADWLVDRSRVIFSVSRFVINSSVTTWGLMATQHLPFEVALTAGVLAGGISGSLQYFNAHVRKYLTSSLSESLLRGEKIRKAGKTIEPFFRWYLMEVGFVGVVQIALTALGHPPAGTLIYNVGKNLTTALATLAAQGGWDVAVSKVTEKNITLAKTLRLKKMISFRADLVTLGLSALSVAGMVGKLSGFEFGDTIFWGLGITGTLYLAKITYKEWKCRQLLKTPNLTKPTDTLSSPPPSSGGDDSSSAFLPFLKPKRFQGYAFSSFPENFSNLKFEI